MSVKYMKRKEDVFNKFDSKGKLLINETQNKIKEENNIDKNEKEILNKLPDFQKNKSENDNITKLKKELYPVKFNLNSLGTINNNNNIGIFGPNNYLYDRNLNAFNSCNKNTNINNCIEPNILIINYKNIILKNQLNNIIQLESQFKKLKEIGLKALSNTNNKNYYLLNISRKPIFNDSIYHYIKNNKLNNYNYLAKNYNQNKQEIIKEKKKEMNELINNPKKENAAKEKNLNTKQIKSLINIQLILKGEEKRTVVRLHPIPQHYSSFDVSKLIDQYLHIENGKNQRIYKALYVPLSKTIGKNIGFCFIMMVEPKYVIDFYTTFNGITFNKKKSRKPCTVIWADVQGDDFLKISDDPIRSPIIFKDLIDKK